MSLLLLRQLWSIREQDLIRLRGAQFEFRQRYKEPSWSHVLGWIGGSPMRFDPWRAYGSLAYALSVGS